MAPSYVIDFTVGWRFGEPQRFVSQVLEINGYDPDTDHYDFRLICERDLYDDCFAVPL